METKPTSVTLPQAFVLTIVIGACTWCFNSIQTALGHTAAADTQKDARDRELDKLTDRVTELERAATARCHDDR